MVKIAPIAHQSGQISVIIPTFNEAENVEKLIRDLTTFGQNALAEIIVVDADSTDQTAAVAHRAGAKVVVSAEAGRAVQMNVGAQKATGDILYFVHADTQINPDFVADIRQALAEGYALGCYRYVFDSPRLMLRFNAYCTRFDRIWCRGGDQTLFVPQTVFSALNGFRPDHRIMEDYDFILRARKQYRFKIIPKNVVVSARKYATNSYLRVQVANFSVFLLYFMGASQNRLVKTYKTLLNYR